MNRTEEKQEPVQSETLLVALFPKKCFQDRSYKDERGVITTINASYFDAAAYDLGKALSQTFGTFFAIAKHQTSKGNINYTLGDATTTADYAITGTDRWMSDKGEVWSSEVLTLLVLHNQKIDLPQTATLLNYLFERNLLDYRPESKAKFGIFYADREGKSMQGEHLLQTLGIRPTEAAEFFQVMYFSGYKHKTFDILGPE